MKQQEEKTNVTRMLGQKKLPYKIHTYEGTTVGTEVAALIGQDVTRVFKTLVTRGASGGHYVFMIPVHRELDLKKATRAAGEKSLSMLPSKELLPLTGYIHGGCSPIGMKKQFPTFIDASAEEIEGTIFFSAGKVGVQVEMPVADLRKIVEVKGAEVVVE